MDFRVDPFTGGIKRVDLEKEEENQKQMKAQLSKNLIPQFVKDMALNTNPEYNPQPSRYLKLTFINI